MRREFAIAAAWMWLGINGVKADQVAAVQPAETPPASWSKSIRPIQEEGWERVEVGSKLFVVYAAYSSVIHDGANVLVPVRAEWMDPQESPPTRISTYLSDLSRIEFNCAAKSYRHRADTAYAGNNLTGEAASADANQLEAWTAMFPEPIGQRILSAVCSRVGVSRGP
jgi:hypothetical protein